MVMQVGRVGVRRPPVASCSIYSSSDDPWALAGVGNERSGCEGPPCGWNTSECPTSSEECPAGEEPLASLLARRPQQEARPAIPICTLLLYLRAGPWLQTSPFPTALQSSGACSAGQRMEHSLHSFLRWVQLLPSSWTINSYR